MTSYLLENKTVYGDIHILFLLLHFILVIYAFYM